MFKKKDYKKILVTFIFCAFFSASVFAQTKTSNEIPPEYESDKCTFFPDGNYADCCITHDREYFIGGSCRERRKSDNRLYRCVRSKKGWYNKIVAPVMWVGVRIGGVSFLPTPFRWGFGEDWKKKRKKQKRKYQDKSRIRPALN